MRFATLFIAVAYSWWPWPYDSVVTGKWRELESRFQVRFPGIDFHCQSARFFLLALIIIVTLSSHGYEGGTYKGYIYSDI